MTRISSYSLDNNIGGNDKWIGSDAQNFLITKNFTPNNVADYFNGNNVIDIGTSIRYVYQTLNVGEQRRQGTISFETEIGPQVNFSAITTFLIAKSSLKQNDVSQYLDFLVDGKVLLSKASNINIFGYYKITSLQPWIPNTNFFVVTVDFLEGNGFIYEDLDYLVSLVDKAQDVLPTTWGSITGNITNQTDLINYISSELVPYFLTPTGTTLEYVRGDGSLATFPITPTTPTLQQVVNIGNGISNFGGTGVASIQSTNFTSGRTLYLNDNSYPTIRLVDNANASNYLQIDIDTLNIDGVSYNWSSIVNPPASPLSALPFTTDHLTATGNQYVVGDLVWYLGNVYRCIASNDSLLPTNTLYWTNLGAGYPLVQQPSDWNATSGNNQILNKPTIPTVGTWGALNYPTWTTGTPFVKMTAVGTFALDTNTYVTTANAALQNAYDNSTDGKIILDATRGDIKVKSIAGITKSMSFFDPLGNEVLTFQSEQGGANIRRISANGGGFNVDSGSNIQGSNLVIADIYSTGDIYLSNNKSLVSYLNPLATHYFKGTSGVKWESDVKIEYAADYSALYSNRSLVDKEYVDGLITSGTVTSVGLTMPSAFSVTNSPITSSGDIAVTGAGLVSQYVRGDGTLANFPSSTGGGSSLNYYLNGSVSQGTFGGTTYYQMSKTPILGAGTNFTRTNGAGNGYIASFITDAGDPSFLNIPAGNWNLEFYFQSSSTGGSPQFYGEIYKVSATNVFTLVASGSANPEGITNGTTVDQYFTSISVPQTSLLITDRLAVRIFVNTGGRTIRLHTENGNLSEVLTTFTTGLTALNGLTDQVQFFNVGTGATNFNISSSGDTHTFNLLFNIRRNANNSSNNNINYNGYAVTGSVESSAVWTITRLTIAASGSITIATATNVAWTNRESATYI